MRTRTLLIAAVLAVSAGCTPTTYDAADATAKPTTPTSSTLPSDDPDTLLPIMLSEVADLSRRVTENDGDGAAATRIEVMWATIREPVRVARPELVSGFDFVVRRCRAAADRNRPADADRAFKNLEALVDAYLAV